MNRPDFEDLDDMASRLEDEFKTFNDDSINDESNRFNEYGEIEDDDRLSVEDENIEDIEQDTNTLNTKDAKVALRSTPSTSHSKFQGNSWMKRSYLAVNETDKEFELFRIYCMYGGGRSLQYISTVSNVTPSILHKLSKQNNWKRRAEDYDRAELVKKMQQVQTSKHELHIKKLEKYREEQEALGQQLTLNAARIAFLANNTLSKMLDEDKELDVRDLPGMLNVAAKLADVGKNLQSTSLGVDNLLTALEEAEGE